ncbi:putative Abi/CAAX family protease [Hyella patelloides LEGE 07179]|uniref:Putative Abi/CAAX family protease n=1 Tax=Hyella patelloides LEGE 07179 TaxID=945734 RepID=A0A563W2I8_9CYAN|nr:CPBP family glutamic-type intramembrane protease [Hyella patelloides]VEP17912.1 putative Abi/CAAX family protease [Hyella patelloides LEGE 07179]
MIELIKAIANLILNKIASLPVVLGTLPSKNDWLLGIVLLLFYGLVALFWGFKSNFFHLRLLTSPLKVSQIIMTSFFAPALLEEIVFRVFLLPQPTQNLEQLPWIVITIDLLIFVVYHPLNALTFFPKANVTFLNYTFLSLTALLGFICVIAYWQSGSVWLPVILHWITVITWLIGLGGYDRLYKIDTNN